MVRIVAVFACGVGIGVLVTVALRPAQERGRDSGDAAAATVMAIDAIPARDDHEPSYDELVQRVTELEEYISVLENDAGGPTEIPPDGSSAELIPESPVRSGALRHDRLVEQLVAGGFTQDRAEWIKRRYDELGAALLQESVPLAAMMSHEGLAFDLNHRLRQELGDTEYEHYRVATTGQRSAIIVWGITEDSPAAFAGLRQSDRIVAYAGQRVFDAREIPTLALQGVPGEFVIVDILRNGQPIQISLQRGTVGATLFSGGSVVTLSTH